MPALKLSKKDARKLTRALRRSRPCLLCGASPPAYSVLFLPEKPEAWGGKPGKARALAYALCARCFALPDKAQHVEARIMASLVGSGN